MCGSDSEIICVEEACLPRPHYRVTMKTVTLGHPDLAPGLLQDVGTMTVCLPTCVGTDLKAIKRAAARRFAILAAKVVDYDEMRGNGDAGARRLKSNDVEHRADEEQRDIALVNETD